MGILVGSTWEARKAKRMTQMARVFMGGIAGTALLALSSLAQAPTPATRIVAEIDNSERATIPGSHPPLARTENETGRLPGGTKLQSVSIIFSPSAQQESDLQALIAAQQNPTSSQYHQWLTPDQFATRFGLADEDLAKVQMWLQKQGFSIDGVARSKNRLTFSGSAEQVEAAFATEMHYYTVNGKQHFAPSTDLSIPAALASVVQHVGNLSTFKPKSHLKHRPLANFTSSQTGNHFLTPGDVATIYDIAPAYKAGFNGGGQTIAVVGQSAIVVTDIENFESAAGLPKKDPTLILVPNSGTSTVVTGDEAESDLDLEYAGGIAPGATIDFVYVGNSTNYSVFDSIQYAVDNRTAPIISTSYGDCEPDFAQSDYTSLNAVLAQAASQGQTVIAPAGDNGSPDCYGDTGLTTAQQEVVAVDFPASSQYVTGMGGTEFPSADVAAGNNTYWTAQGSSDVISSALSYIPEQVWNDDSSAGGLSAGGGGVSTLTPRPSWQVGVPGITSGSFRLVPDISLTASPNNAGFLYCSSDNQNTQITGSCANGFRDSSNTNLTVAGGTSFDVPMFAGMVAIINQKLGSTGQGVVSPILYTLASNSSTYSTAFHDITSGNNNCSADPSVCVAPATTDYPATTGYDQASGLGSIDFMILLSAWPGPTSIAPSPSFTLSVANLTVSAGSSGTTTLTVTPQNGYTGTVAFTITSSPSIANACFSAPNVSVTSATPATPTLTVQTTSSACASGAMKGGSGKVKTTVTKPVSLRSHGGSTSSFKITQAGLGLAGGLLLGVLGIRKRKLAAFLGVSALLFTVLGFGLVGCSSGGGSSTTSTTTAAKGTYTITVVGTDTTTSSITASTTFTLTID